MIEGYSKRTIAASILFGIALAIISPLITICSLLLKDNFLFVILDRMNDYWLTKKE